MNSKSRIGNKIIKKSARILAWVIGILILFYIDFYIALRNPKVQTYLSQKLSAYLSAELKAKITIRGVDIEFFKKVVLEGIYVEDQHGDTLLYAEQLKADITRYSSNDKYISISGIDLFNAKVKIKKYAHEHGLSYNYILNYFNSNDTTKIKSAPWKINIGGIGLHNITFAYMDTRDTVNDPGMDYENIRVTGVNANLIDIDPMTDSLSFRIKNLEGTERCGLALKDFYSRITVSNTFAHFDNLSFNTKGSSVAGFISFYFKSPDDISDDFIRLVKMDGHFTTSVIEMGEIAYFSPDLLGIRKKIMLTGDINGTVDHLRCKNVDLRFGEESHIAGNFSFDGLPDMNQTDMDFKLREAITNKKDLEGIPVAPFDDHHFIQVGNNVGQLGEMRFSGSFEGFLNDFVAFGKLQTSIGTLSLENLAMTRDSDNLPYTYSGEVNAQQFNVGSFFNIPDLSIVTGDVNIQGTGFSGSDISANIDGKISLLKYHNYPYTNISVTNGNVRRQVFSGDVTVDDPNLQVVFKGNVDNSGLLPQMKFIAKIDSANLGELGFLDKTHKYLLNADLQMDFTGNNIDNLDGQMNVNNLEYIKDGQKFSFNEFDLFADGDPEKDRTISLQSDIVTITLKGKFKLMRMEHSVRDILSIYLPAYFIPDNDAEAVKDPVQDFNFYVAFQKNTKPIEALVPGLEIAPQTFLKGYFSSLKSIVNFQINSGSVVFNDIKYNQIELNVENTSHPGKCILHGSVDEMKITDTIGVKQMTLDCQAIHDSLYTTLMWDNHTEKANDADIDVLLLFENPHSIKIDMDSAFIHLNDSLWTVMPGNYLQLDSNTINFHNVTFSSGQQSIGLNGILSTNPNDPMKISLNKFNIAYLNYFTKQKGVTLAGIISSETEISDIYHKPVFTSNTDFQKLFINGQNFGDGELDADWQKNKQAVYLHGNFTKGIPDPVTGTLINNILFEGFFYPNKTENSIDITASFADMPLDAFAPLLQDYCSILQGEFDGTLHVTGIPSKPLLDGKMMMAIKHARVDYLGLDISASSQPVTIEQNSFFFDNYKVKDAYGNSAKIYGHLFHENFRNFQFDMDFSFDHFNVLNTTADENELYYGRVFSTGYMNVFGYVDDIIRIDMQVSTDKIVYNGQKINSEFFIPMSSTSEASSSDFISFVNKKLNPDSTKNQVLKNNGLELHLNVDVTPDCEVKVVFDKTVGDEITAYGSGNLQMAVTPAGDFTIFGQYAVDKGDYLFTMKNLIFEHFDIAKGGLISWNGDPYQAKINADAVYKCTASVEPFFPMDSTNEAYHRSYPVEVVMHLEKNLMNPDVSFDINLPTADQNIQETVKSYTATDLEKNKQVLSLMVLNSFMTPTELREGNTANQNVGGAASATLLSNFVSGTLNNWLGQISTDYTFNVQYRPNDDLSTQELKVYLSKEFLNNRISVDVDAGKINANQATATNANGQLVGDFNIEYKITPDGKVRLRGFNRANDNTVLIENSPYTQGVGIFYREEFDTNAELKSRYKKTLTTRKANRNKKPAADSTPQ